MAGRLDMAADLAGRVALVTGAARGMGAQNAEYFAEIDNFRTLSNRNRRHRRRHYFLRQ